MASRSPLEAAAIRELPELRLGGPSAEEGALGGRPA
jgi:hypothetical protein